MKRPIVGKMTSFDKNADSFGKFLAYYSSLQEAGCSYRVEVVALWWVGWGGRVGGRWGVREWQQGTQGHAVSCKWPTLANLPNLTSGKVVTQKHRET